MRHFFCNVRIMLFFSKIVQHYFYLYFELYKATILLQVNLNQNEQKSTRQPLSTN